MSSSDAVNTVLSTVTKEVTTLPVSKPMKLVAVRFSEDEKARLAEKAAERNITLSYAMREGLRLYLDDLSMRREPDPARLRKGVRVGT
jgi:hypothetical protein